MLAANIPWAAFAPLIALALAFEVYCVVDVVRSEVQSLPKWAWILLILLVSPIGGIAYLIAGRKPA